MSQSWKRRWRTGGRESWGGQGHYELAGKVGQKRFEWVQEQTHNTTQTEEDKVYDAMSLIPLGTTRDFEKVMRSLEEAGLDLEPEKGWSDGGTQTEPDVLEATIAYTSLLPVYKRG